MNKVILLGNLGKDPEIKTFDNGGKIAKFSLATTEKWKDKTTGETKEDTQWHNISVGGKLADVVQNYVKKGSSVLIEGKIKTRSWETNGEKKYITEVHAESLTMVGRPNGVDPSQRFQGQQQQPAAAPIDAQVMPEDDDLPF